MKKFILGIIVGIVISSAGIFAASNYLYKADEVSYTPSDTSWAVDSVSKAIDELHSKAKTYMPIPTATKTITSNGSNIDVLNYSKVNVNVAGGGMSVIKFGTISTTTTIDLGTTLDPSQYMVNIHTNGYSTTGSNWINGGMYGSNIASMYGYGYGDGAYLSAKTSTSCTITVSSGITVSYEIVKLSNTKLETSNLSSNNGVVKYGTITSTSTINLGTTLDSSKYLINIYTNGYATTGSNWINGGMYGSNVATMYGYGYGKGAYLSDKTSTSCTIDISPGITASYEIVKIG